MNIHMIPTTRLLKVALAWTSVVYIVCFAGVALIPNIRPNFMYYGLHTMMPMTPGFESGYLFRDVLSFGTFISGLVIWDIIALLVAWLFAALWNGLKR
jgi:hypothetical protein